MRNRIQKQISFLRHNASLSCPGLKAVTKSSLLAGIFLCFTVSGLCQGPPPPPPQGRPPEPNVAPVPAGGKWLEFDSKDPMTDVKRARFELDGDNPLRDSERTPKIKIGCENGNYLRSDFVPGVRVRPDRPGFWGQPQLEVRVRADGNVDKHGWNWDGTFLTMDKDSVRRLAEATVFKIQLPGPGTPDNIATFSPAGLDFARFESACHLKPKR